MNNFRWEKYKSFFQITIFKYLVMWFSLVPIVANIIQNLPDKYEVTLGTQAYFISLTLPFNWQLLWISSVFFVIALVVYHIFCPNFISKYNSFKDYESYSHDPRWVAWEASMLWPKMTDEQKKKFISRLQVKEYSSEIDGEGSFIISKNPIVDKLQTIFYFQHYGKKYKLGMPVLNPEDQEIVGSEKGVFFEVFGRYSESNYLARLIILILLIISGVIFGFVLCQHLYSGAQFVWSWVTGVST